MDKQTVRKEDILDNIGDSKSSALDKYQSFFVGKSGIINTFKYDLAHIFAAPMPGALGYVLRKFLMLPLLKKRGKNVNFGRSVTLRHPGKISIGDNTAIDDYCLLDARGLSDKEFIIGANVMIARDTTVISKTDYGAVEIGDNCTISKNCILTSSGGIQLGKWVGVAGGCYIGGGRYRTDNGDIPIKKQDMYSEGPIIIGDDVWIGAGVTILDGVRIGRGSVIGAGAIVRENIPEYTTVTPHQRLVMLPRNMEDNKKTP